MSELLSLTRLHRLALPLSLLLALLLAAGCATRAPIQEPEPEFTEAAVETPEPAEAELPVAEATAQEAGEGEEEVPLAVAESEKPAPSVFDDGLPEVVVRPRERHEVIRDLMGEAQVLLREEELRYVITGKGRRETLRGRPVIFALWNEATSAWTMAHIEIPRPPVRWKPGRRFNFTLHTPGVRARHVKGTGAERLMFSFTTREGEPLKVYGRKFPVFDNALLKKKRWREVVATARPIVYLPFTEDTLDPQFISGGREYLLSTARQAIAELRAANVPSAAYPGQALADVVPAEVITTLAVIEQTDDGDFREKGMEAFEEVLSHYGLKRDEAYRYSVSSAAALGPMQFTNRRGNGTYALVVRRCRGAGLDPNFERGATNLLNAMKAAICLFDIELNQMRAEIREAYRDNQAVLGIFPVAAYNGGPRNVTRLARVLQRMKVSIGELRRQGEQIPGRAVACPCVWRDDGDGGVRPVAIPRYNNENRWYIEKYQNILSLFE